MCTTIADDSRLSTAISSECVPKFVPEGGLDSLSQLFTVAIEALGVDLEEYLDGVSRPCSDIGCRHACIEPRRHSCVAQVVRSRASGDTATSSVNAFRRASRHTRLIVPLGSSEWLRSPTNRRPSVPVPNSALWRCNISVSSGGHGTVRISPTVRCLSWRRSRFVPLSVHSRPAYGSATATWISPQPAAGISRSVSRRPTASSGRSAA